MLLEKQGVEILDRALAEVCNLIETEQKKEKISPAVPAGHLSE